MTRAKTGWLTAGPIAVFIAVALALGILAACGGASNQPVAVVPGGDAAQGKQLIMAYGCGACHTIPGIPGADAKVGPPLTSFAERGYIGGLLVNSPDNLVRWLENPQAVKPGVDMPNMGVHQDEARNIAAYLYSLK